MIDDKVLDFRSRRPLAEVRQREEDEARELEEATSRMAEQDRKITEESYRGAGDAVSKLVEDQELDGLIVIAKHKKTGLFYTDIAFGADGCLPEEAFAWVGVLETLKTEMIDIAMMAPTVTPEGNVTVPMMTEDYDEDSE